MKPHEIAAPVAAKTCRVCGETKPVRAFPVEDGYADGVGRNQCRECTNQRRRERYQRAKAAKEAGL